MPETIDAEKFDIESLLSGNGIYDDVLNTLSSAQIDDRSCLKRFLSHMGVSFDRQKQRGKCVGCTKDAKSHYIASVRSKGESQAR